MMDKVNLLKKYKAKQAPIMKLKTGESVIGTEVDENNYLYYVIVRGNDISIEQANLHRVDLGSITIHSDPEVHINKKP